MTATAEESLTAGEFDWAGEIGDPEAVEAAPGPLTGSRGTRQPTTRRRRSAGTKKLEALQKRLSTEMFQAGTMIGFGLHTTGYYIAQESDNFTKAVVQLAASRPEWIDALENVANIQPGLVIGRTVIGIGAALAVDRGRANPERQVMKMLGVYSAWQAVNEGGEPVRVEGSAYTPPPAGAFVPVT